MSYRKITKAEKLGRDLVERADALKIRRGVLEAVDKSNSIYNKDVDDWNWTDYLRALAENVKEGARLTGVTLLWLGEHLTRAANKIFVDNKLVRELEVVAEKSAKIAENKIDKKTGKKVGETKLTKYVKEHPWVAGYMTYFAVLVAGSAGAYGIADAVLGDDKEEPKKEVVKETQPGLVVNELQDKAEEEDAPKDIVTTTETRTVSPDEVQFVKQAIDEYWPEIAIGLTELETYRIEPKRHGTEARSTNGLGCTYTYYYNKKGELYREPNSTDVKKVKIFGKAQNYEQCKRHLIYELLPGVQRAIKGKNNIGAQQAIAVAWAGYQRPADMAEIANRISKATTVQQVADAFAYYPGPSKWREGTLKRRWWCAAYAVGAIDINDFLGLNRDAFSRVNINNIYRNGHFLLGEETIKYALGRAAGVDRVVSDFLKDFDEGKKILASVKKQDGGKKLSLSNYEKTRQDSVIEKSMGLLNQAESKFAKGDYSGAESLYLQAIKKDADNMEAYSSLALTYKKLGDKHKSLDYYEKCVNTVKQGNARMNANKSLLLDRDVKAASYFNAGTAREEMAKIYLARGDKDKAYKNYDMAIKNYKTALENADMDDLGAKRKKIYQDAIDRASKQLNSINVKKGNKVAFDSGIKQLRQKNAKSDIFLYGKEFNGNMA